MDGSLTYFGWVTSGVWVKYLIIFPCDLVAQLRLSGVYVFFFQTLPFQAAFHI